MTIYSREYFNILDQDMRNCSTTANMIKRNGFYENATGGSSSGPSADEIRTHYNIDNAVNIYIVDNI